MVRPTKPIFGLAVTVTTLLLISLFPSTHMGFSRRDTYGQISSSGLILHRPDVSIVVKIGTPIGINKLSLGFQVDYPWEWRAFRDRPAQRQLVIDANFKMVRIFDRHMGPLDYAKGVGPCKYWNETTKTGTFDWTDVDSVVQAIFSVGAEPLITLSAWHERPIVPPGMAVDPSTLLPHPQSYAAFAAAWVQHFKDVSLPVRYFEIFNEIQTYIGWSWDTRKEARTDYFIELFNSAYTRMHSTNQNVIISFDASTLKWVFPRLLANAAGIDSFNFHKYDDWKAAPRAFSDQEMFQRAENVYFQRNDRDTYTLDYVRQTWFEQRGAWLPAILSEGNWNAAYGPTDERIQQMAGAVRTALVLRMEMLKGIDYNVYYTLNSDSIWETEAYGSGYGYGMIDCNSRHTAPDYDTPWYPYYVQKIIGANLAIGDPIIETSSDWNEIRTIAWLHDSTLNVLLISMSEQTLKIQLEGVDGVMSYLKIDNTFPFSSPVVQEGAIDAEAALTVDGYTIILLQNL